MPQHLHLWMPQSIKRVFLARGPSLRLSYHTDWVVITNRRRMVAVRRTNRQTDKQTNRQTGLATDKQELVSVCRCLMDGPVSHRWAISASLFLSIEQQTIFVFADKRAFVIYNHVCPKIKHASWLAHWYICIEICIHFQTIDLMTKLAPHSTFFYLFLEFQDVGWSNVSLMILMQLSPRANGTHLSTSIKPSPK